MPNDPPSAAESGAACRVDLRKLLLWTASHKLENPPEATVRRLRPAEAHVVRAHLLSRVNPERALQQIDLAASADRLWPDVFY